MSAPRSRQRLAARETDCTACHRYIAQDDPIWYLDGNVHCVTCAARKSIECPDCHGSKKPHFPRCYNCAQEAKAAKGAALV